MSACVKSYRSLIYYGSLIILFPILFTGNSLLADGNKDLSKQEYVFLPGYHVECPIIRYFIDDNIVNTKYFATPNVPEPSLSAYKTFVREAADKWNQVNAAIILVETTCEDNADLTISCDPDDWADAACGGHSACYVSEEKKILIQHELVCTDIYSYEGGTMITDFKANGLTGGYDCIDDCINNQAIPECFGHDDCGFNEEDLPPCENCVSVDLLSLLIHEFGHALGLDHTQVSNVNSVMRSSEDIFVDDVFGKIQCWYHPELGQDDKNGLLAKYGQFQIEGPAPICGNSFLSLGNRWVSCQEDLATTFNWEVPDFIQIENSQGGHWVLLNTTGPVPETFTINVRLEISDLEHGEVLATKLIASRTFSKDIVYSNSSVVNGDVMKAQNIRIKSGADVRINNSDIRILPGGTIFLEKGSRLVIQGSTLEGCNSEKWKGIFMATGEQPESAWGDLKEGNAPILILQNDSEIRNSEYGATNMPGEDCIGFSVHCIKTNGIIDASNTKFYDNNIGLFFNKQYQSISNIESCKFENNSIGIKTLNSSGIEISNSTFLYNDEGIVSLDSYIKINGSNEFKYNTETGVVVAGSFPLSSGAQIGIPGSGNKNTFQTNGIDISASGNTHPNQLIIQNNLFQNFLSNFDFVPGVAINGWNNFEFANNSLIDYEFPLIAKATGGFDNKIQCNEMISSVFDIWFIGDNSSTEFLENYFFIESNWSPGVANVGFYENAIVKSIIGTSDSPAGNAFETCGIQDTGVEFDTDSSEPFVYLYYSPIECHEPISLGNYSKLPSQNLFDYCDEEIGIFHLIDPDGDGEVGLAAGFDKTNTCKSCVAITINNLQSSLNGLGIEHPNTTIDVQSLENYYQVKLQLEEWVRFAIQVSEETNDPHFAISILNNLSSDWLWLQSLFGVYIKNTMWPQAENLLSNLDTNDPEKATFRAIQNINIKYLKDIHGVHTYTVTQNDLDLLLEYGQTEYSSFAYARGLYKILTGENIPIILPDITSRRSRDIPSVKMRTKIFPNPIKSGNTWTIKSEYTISSITLSDLSGKEYNNKKVYANLAEIKTNGLNPGVYIIRIEFENRPEEFHKLIMLGN